MGLHFQGIYFDRFAYFRDFGGKKIVISRDLKMGRFVVKKLFG